MNRQFAVLFILVSLISTAAPLTACDPMGPMGMEQILFVSVFFAMLQVVVYGALSGVVLVALRRRLHLQWGSLFARWVFVLLVTEVVATVGNVVGLKMDQLGHSELGFVFAATLPLVALSGLFVRLRQGTASRIARSNPNL